MVGSVREDVHIALLPLLRLRDSYHVIRSRCAVSLFGLHVDAILSDLKVEIHRIVCAVFEIYIQISEPATERHLSQRPGDLPFAIFDDRRLVERIACVLNVGVVDPVMSNNVFNHFCWATPVF